MDDLETAERFKALRSEIRDLHDEVEKLRKRKANGEDVEAIVKKVSDIETEMRTKFTTLQSGNLELLSEMRKLTTSVEGLRSEVALQQTTVNTLKETNKGSVWERIPKLVWLLMGVGVLALMQQGPTMWANLQGIPR